MPADFHVPIYRSHWRIMAFPLCSSAESNLESSWRDYHLFPEGEKNQMGKGLLKNRHSFTDLYMWFQFLEFTKKVENILFLKDFIYLFLDRGEGKEKERERNTNVWLYLCCPYWGAGPQPRHVPWLGTKPVTLWFASQHSIHWATPARVKIFLNVRWLQWQKIIYHLRNTCDLR